MLRRVSYWVLIVLLTAWLLAGGLFDLSYNPAAVAILHKLGYPNYLGGFLGVCKLLAVLALLYPRTRFLREWAYTGVAFDALGAAYSHLAVHDSAGEIAAPLLMLAFATGSYLLRPAAYRLRPAKDISSHAEQPVGRLLV
jgi:DoxX-like family